ncbi:hypothetical protein ACHAXH_006765 [Discostella pseudostelligera]
MLNDSTWPVVGNPVPPPLNATSSQEGDPSSPPEWEMIAEEEEENEKNIVESSTTIPSTNHSSDNYDCVFVIHGPSNIGKKEQRPRSATVGGDAAAAAAANAIARLAATNKSSSFGCEEKIERAPRSLPRTLRRCASTPDLVVCDNAHEVIVEDESDSEDYDDDGNDEVEHDDVVVSEKHNEGAEVIDGDEPFMIDVDEDDFTNLEGESATLVSSPSIGTSSWTITSSVLPPTNVWGMKKSPSFKDVLLAKNVEGDAATCETGVFGKDRALTEAKLRDPHRHHHLRVRTKPKFIVTDVGNSSERKMMRHANSTGDLTRMLSNVEEGHESSIGQCGRNRRSKKQLSAMMEEDEDGDFVIGRGSGKDDVAGGGSGVFGETDAMDFYQRKEHGSRSISNKKKERPDEAKRREIIMYKKDAQRRQNGENQKGRSTLTTSAAEDVKKKKNDKGVGGKKERRRLC